VLGAHLQISAAEELRNAAEAPTQIEDESIGTILLQVRYQEIDEERLPRSSAPQDNRVRRVLIMQVQKIRSAVIGLQHCQIFRIQMLVAALSGVEREQE